MTRLGLIAVGAVAMVLLLLAVAMLYLRASELSARDEAGAVEEAVARAARRIAIPAATRQLINPVPLTEAALEDGMAHFADHCASCHGNDGSGATEMGRGFYPKAPDMRMEPTQDLSDGELFHVIEHGIRFTGMPSWGDGSAAGEESSWRLVHFIRRLPSLTAAEIDEMEARNPRSPEEVRQQIEEERFLAGETPAP